MSTGVPTTLKFHFYRSPLFSAMIVNYQRSGVGSREQIESWEAIDLPEILTSQKRIILMVMSNFAKKRGGAKKKIMCDLNYIYSPYETL